MPSYVCGDVVEELKADLNRIRSAPYPSAHVRAKIRQEIEALATARARQWSAM